MTNLNDIIKNRDIFVIKTAGLPKPTIDQIILETKRINLNPKIQWNKISVAANSITDTSATLISLDANVYTGEVDVTYTIDTSTELKDVITNTNLQIIDISGWKNKAALKEIIFAALKKFNPEAVDWSKISIDENSITWEGAEVISNDTTVYSGVVDINFKTNIKWSVNLNFDKSYNGTSTNKADYTSTQIILGFFTDFAEDWDSFTKVCPTLNFDSDSYLWVKTVDGTREARNLSVSTSKITENPMDVKFSCSRHDVKFLRQAKITIFVFMWHDDHNIYISTQTNIFAEWSDEGVFGKIILNNANFLITSSQL